jgi:hypothetical protein
MYYIYIYLLGVYVGGSPTMYFLTIKTINYGTI